jgi:hypothetical protein
VEIVGMQSAPGNAILSVVYACDVSLASSMDRLAEHLVASDAPPVEIVVALFSRSEFSEPLGKNTAAKHCNTERLAFSNVGVYPPPALVAKTATLLQSEPKLVPFALRLDGTPDFGVFPNPWAMGDWQCINMGFLRVVGGFDEGLRLGGGVEQSLFGAAIAGEGSLYLMDERVFHSYHPHRFGDEYHENARYNRARVLERGLPFYELTYPNISTLELPSGEHLDFPIRGDQKVPRPPRHPAHMQCVYRGKERRLNG